MFVNKLTQAIYDELNEKGAELGNASLGIIQNVVYRNTRELLEEMISIQERAEDTWWIDQEVITDTIKLLEI